MDRAFASGASGTPPTAPASPSIGYPTKGNAGTGTPATKPGEYWYHMITEEMRAVIAAAGLTPSQSDLTQLLQALPGALASRPEMARSLAANGYQKLPSGLIIQWGMVSSIAAGGTKTFTYPVAFPTGPFCAFATPASGTPANCIPFGTNPGSVSCDVTNGGSAVSTAYVLVIGR